MFKRRRQSRDREERSALSAPRYRVSLSRNPDHFYAIGDVHGCLDKLTMLEEAIVADVAGRPGTKLIVLLGDYIDRGPSSAGVIEHLLKPPPAGFHRVCLCGNHEEMLLKLFERPDTAEAWLALGGRQTLFSYGYDLEHLRGSLRRSQMEVMDEFLRHYPPAHIEFLRNLPIMLSSPDFALVHAGVRPGKPIEQQLDQDLMWTRDAAMEGQALVEGKTLVHGHTPRETPLATIDRIAIDTKAYSGGPLTAVRLGGDMAFFLQVVE